MKNEKIQATILKELLSPKGRVAYYIETDENLDDFAVVILGDIAYRIPLEQLKLDLTGVARVDTLPGAMSSLHDPDFDVIKLHPTDQYRLGGSARKYLAYGDEDKPVYVDTKLLAHFDNPTLYQCSAYNPLGLMTVAEWQMELDATVVVGYVLPSRIESEE